MVKTIALLAMAHYVAAFGGEPLPEPLPCTFGCPAPATCDDMISILLKCDDTRAARRIATAPKFSRSTINCNAQ